MIAAALAFGDDPVKACLAPRNSTMRRTLTAAASGLNRSGTPLPAAVRMLGIQRQTVYWCRSKKPVGFLAAEAAAARAVTFARWRPETAIALVELPPTVEVAPAPEVHLDPAVHPDPEPRPPVVEAPVVQAPAIAAPRGRLQADLQIAFRAATPLDLSPVRERILAALQDGSACTQGLATILDIKELTVCSSLSALAHDGLVVAGEMPPEGRRQQRWRLADEARE